ncbi:hypothetical protein AMJ48_01565 [Parcubacteria bacterium DG_74_1]|nr:MAG: hypothetical protein AMJ48_01565 [Parcubacteria bacterium DG_74_1]
MSKKKIVVIGGGTGSFTVLSGLKKYPVDLSAIVAMTDSGGSNRVIRDELGLLPTSDIRQCLVALSEDEKEQSLRKLFTYRFSKGNGLNGMTFGNLFLAALADIFGSQMEAIKKTSHVLKIKGKILPVTLTDSNLVAIYENGKKVIGEHFIDEPKHSGKLKIKKVFLKPKAKICPEAKKEILKADSVVIGPGDLYTSIIAALLTEGMAKVLKRTKAKVVYVMNLMTKYGQTFGFTAKEHIQVLEKYLGRNCLDFILVNKRPIPKSALLKYKKENECPVVDDLDDGYFKVVRGDFLSKKETKRVPGDILKRSLIRHDSKKLARALIKI